MKISELIEKLDGIKNHYGDMEVTCTGCLQEEAKLPTDHLDGKPYETTVENIEMHKHETIGECIRLHP